MGTTVGTVKSQTAKALATLRVDPGLAAAPPPDPRRTSSTHLETGSPR
jgi:hypothetical protein